MNDDEIGNLYLITSLQDQVQNDGFNIYPIPAKESLHINITNTKLSNDFQIEVYNTVGEIVKSSIPALSHNGNYDLDISSLEKGVYILSLRTNDLVIHRRFIKN